MNKLLEGMHWMTLVALALLAGGCEPSAPSAGGPAATTGGPPAPPPPPGTVTPTPMASPASNTAAAPAATSAASGLPADLVKKIDTLIQSHKDYSAAAEKVQDGQGAKDQFDALSAIAQRSSDAYDDVMIGTKQLSPAQMVLFEAYMNQHVSPVWETRKQHQARLESLLPR